MQYNVSSLLKEHTGATRAYEVDDELRVDGETSHVAGHVRLDRTHDGILVRADLTCNVHADCSRCLKPLTLALHIAFEEEYLPVVDVITGARLDPPEGEEDAYRISERHILDLGEAAAQYRWMALPMAPACPEPCGQQCASCGEFVTASSHVCGSAETDARWAGLRRLKLG